MEVPGQLPSLPRPKSGPVRRVCVFAMDTWSTFYTIYDIRYNWSDSRAVTVPSCGEVRLQHLQSSEHTIVSI